MKIDEENGLKTSYGLSNFLQRFQFEKLNRIMGIGLESITNMLPKIPENGYGKYIILVGTKLGHL